MKDSLQTINLAQLRSAFPGENSTCLEDDFLLKEAYNISSPTGLQHPLRFDGYLGFFVESGHLDVEVNMKNYEVGPDSFMIIVPGYIVRVNPQNKPLKDLRVVLVALSKSFMPNIHIDFNNLFQEGMIAFDSPTTKLQGKEKEICKHYMTLTKAVMSSDIANKKEIVSHLASSVLYVFASLWTASIDAARAHTPAATSRSKIIFDQFLRLVGEYHCQERTMAFYADRLCLTPKYLSKLVKQVSGRSAPDWIDAFVILEAKNLLKYSDASIKEIVYRLHFPNQSVFYKFFKAHTGMTPSAYRNS